MPSCFGALVHNAAGYELFITLAQPGDGRRSAMSRAVRAHRSRPSFNLGRSGTPSPPAQKKRGNRRSFLAEIAFGRVPPSLPVPIPGIGKIALDAM